MTDATKEAPQAATKTDKDYRERFYELDRPLRDAWVWASLLDKVVDDLGRLPSMSRREADIAYGELDRVNDALKEAIDQLDATYHQRTEEEASL